MPQSPAYQPATLRTQRKRLDKYSAVYAFCHRRRDSRLTGSPPQHCEFQHRFLRKARARRASGNGQYPTSENTKETNFGQEYPHEVSLPEVSYRGNSGMRENVVPDRQCSLQDIAVRNKGVQMQKREIAGCALKQCRPPRHGPFRRWFRGWRIHRCRVCPWRLPRGGNASAKAVGHGGWHGFP